MSPSTRPPTKVAPTTARIRMGGDTVTLSEVYERSSMSATTATARAGPSNRRAYSLRSLFRRTEPAALGPAARSWTLRGVDAGLTGYRAYREATLASRLKAAHCAWSAQKRQNLALSVRLAVSCGNEHLVFQGIGDLARTGWDGIGIAAENCVMRN